MRGSRRHHAAPQEIAEVHPTPAQCGKNVHCREGPERSNDAVRVVRRTNLSASGLIFEKLIHQLIEYSRHGIARKGTDAINFAMSGLP